MLLSDVRRKRIEKIKKRTGPFFQRLSLSVLLLRKIGTFPLLEEKGACPLFLHGSL